MHHSAHGGFTTRSRATHFGSWKSGRGEESEEAEEDRQHRVVGMVGLEGCDFSIT